MAVADELRLNMQPQKRHGFLYMTAMGFLVGGFSSVESITNTMIPLTCRHFTDSAFVIALILSSNRFFGFTIGPYVAWKSDHISTRYGRRRPFFMVGLPFTILSLLVIGALPYIFQGEARQTSLAFSILVLANLSLQFFQDVNWGSSEPLYADTFPQQTLGRAVAFREVAGKLVFMSMAFIAFRLADISEFYAYLCSIAWTAVSLVLVIFVIREQPRPPVEKVHFNPLKHMGFVFTRPQYLKVCFASTMALLVPVLMALFTSLFATGTLAMTKTQLGWAIGWGPVVALVLSYPVGYLTDRISPKWMISLGFLGTAGICMALSFYVHDFRTFFIFSILQGIAMLFIALPMTAMVFQYASDRDRGTLYGSIQYIRGGTAFVMSLVTGAIVNYSASYEPTPLYLDDIKNLSGLKSKLLEPKDPVSEYVAANLSEPTVSRLRKEAPADKDARTPHDEETKRILAENLNEILRQPGLYQQSRFSQVELTRQSRKMLSTGESVNEGDTLFVLNRSLFQDAFAGEISRKVNYRMSYLVCAICALIAAFVVMSTPKGKSNDQTSPGSTGTRS